MSGRSAYVRKEKEKTKKKDGRTTVVVSSVKASTESREPSFSEFPLPSGIDRSADFGHTSPTAPRSVVSSHSDEAGYARVRKPHVPIIDVSGIEKSSFRTLVDRKSEGVRKGLSSLSFGKKKKGSQLGESRPSTSATTRPPDAEIAELDYNPPPYLSRPLTQREPNEAARPGPPLGKLPSLPEPPQLRRWLGSGRPSQPWNKLRKDPELWDPHGDTLVYLSQPTLQEGQQPPSFRVSSHVIEATESRFLISALRQGYTDRSDSDHSPPSFMQTRTPFSEAINHDMDGQISYELHFPAPSNVSKLDASRHHVTTRNMFALLYQASLVGYNLFQALDDLQVRLQIYMPPDVDSASLIIEYIMAKGLDDARDDPATAISFLAWSETRSVRWQEGWGESFVHCAGMLNRLESIPEYRHVTPITKALLERASLETQVRVQSVEDRLADFDFSDMWPAMSPTQPPERGSFERLRNFFTGHYSSNYGRWPAPAPPDAEQWLTRIIVQELQKDFGALYDYIVDREVLWDCSEERSSRKWVMVNSDAQKPFEADSSQLPMTDIFVAFDNRHRYPHIPHPYPLVPQSISPKSTEYFHKANKTKPDDKMVGRKAALAYAEATNIYILGSDFVDNKLVEAFVRFEKNDMPADLDPYAGRRGRWVLIYGILQALASLSVDNPLVRYKEDVPYHLNPRLRGAPPWRGADLSNQEAKHEGSHCWLAPKGWHEEKRLSGVTLHPRPPGGASLPSSVAPSVMEGEGGSSPRNWTLDDLPKLDYPYHKKSSKRSVRSSTAMSTSAESDATSSVKSPTLKNSRRAKATNKDADHSLPRGGYGPGIEKVDENPWPIKEEGRPDIDFSSADGFIVKDFDNYNF